MMKYGLRPGTLVPAAVIAVVLAGCANSSSENAATSPTALPPPNTPPDSPAPTSATTPIVLEVDGQNITGELDDSATAASLIAQLPLALTFRDYGGQEKIADLSAALDLTGAPAESDAEPLMIGYYAPDQRLILYYDHVASFPGIIPIGSYDDIDSIKNQTAEFPVVIRRAN